VSQFLPYHGGWKAAPPVTQALEIVGSDLDHYECPCCGASDRERHLLAYLRGGGWLAMMQGRAILHFAPEQRLTPFIEASRPGRYVLADLFPGNERVQRVDMLAIPFPDASFDFAIANHVLEHVSDDLAALGQLHRVLRPGGLAILQTPYSEVLERTICDPGVTSAEARLQLYGQADHLRLYGRDIFERLRASGFRSRVAAHSAALPDVDPVRFGVNAREPFFLFERV
jgi:SAM-dependent methyltransferase